MNLNNSHTYLDDLCDQDKLAKQVHTHACLEAFYSTINSNFRQLIKIVGVLKLLFNI
jgi:hypothetical protein